MRASVPNIRIADIMDQEIKLQSNSEENSDIASLKIEAANSDRNGRTKLLIRKVYRSGEKSMQWVDLQTFNIWWQLHKEEASLN
ncbi:hypothetical protein [Marinoscillum furvescens]|uniref:Uncharacterized protein n=1 Tax=Marinoscillum furvescens DSM 4134 TaxID=1122208 RepID=A0A3D9L5Z7_MARFU|nr:hypothetical protein [Marinoscillum furvescens]RED99852.1 hypothetical protein C7460_107136 [Marinoscillum furvescens DSM 4134]